MSRLKVVGILGTNGGVSLSNNGSKKSMELVGLNTGNLLFQYSVNKMIQNPIILLQGNPTKESIEFYKNNIDILVIAAANQINPQWDIGSWANLIEEIDKPIVVIGLGAQSNDFSCIDLDLKPGTMRFIDLIKERSKTVGVRGKYTKDVLEKKGVTNTIVTGCPSNFINMNVTGESIQNKIDNIKHKVKPSINLLAGTLEEHVRDQEKHLFNIVSPNLNKIIFQTNIKILEYIISNDNKEGNEYLTWESKIIAPDMETNKYKEIIARYGKYYFDAKAWMDSVYKDDLNIGMRIHGSVAAIQGGGLGVCVAFDSRTSELVKTMGYPYINAKSLIKHHNIQSLIHEVNFCPKDFDDKRNSLLSNVKTVFENSDIKIKI